jgi:hypothetical protein
MQKNTKKCLDKNICFATLAVLFSWVLVGLIMFYKKEKFYLIFTCIIETILTFYHNLRDGRYVIECAIGGTPLKMAECQLAQGINLILINFVTQFSEYIYKMATSKNMVEFMGLCLMVWQISKQVCKGVYPLVNAVRTLSMRYYDLCLTLVQEIPTIQD